MPPEKPSLFIVGTLLALLTLGFVLYYLDGNFPELRLLQDIRILSILFFGVFALGALISYVSTYFATQRFLNLRTDDLYY